MHDQYRRNLEVKEGTCGADKVSKRVSIRSSGSPTRDTGREMRDVDSFRIIFGTLVQVAFKVCRAILVRIDLERNRLVVIQGE